MEITTTEQPKCPYCGKRVRKDRRAYRIAGYFQDGSDFIGHRSCALDMVYPEYAQERHDIRVPR